MANEITVAESDVQDALGEPNADATFEATEAELLVNDELVPHAGTGSNVQDRLEKTAVLIAAAAVSDDGGDGVLSSITQGSAQISYATDSEDASTYWKRAVRLDPTGQLVNIDKPTASIGVPDVRGGR